MKSARNRNIFEVLFLLVWTSSNIRSSLSLSFLAPIRGGSSFCSFHGNSLVDPTYKHTYEDGGSKRRCCLTMRKQKASDRRTRRLQRGDISSRVDESRSPLLTQQSSPLANAAWTHKQLSVEENANAAPSTRGRGRSRKRLQYYNTISSYHNDFLALLTEEYRAEVRPFYFIVRAFSKFYCSLNANSESIYFNIYSNIYSNIYFEIFRNARLSVVWKRLWTIHSVWNLQDMPSLICFLKEEAIFLQMR